MKTAWTPGPWITIEISPTVIAQGASDTPKGASIAHVYRAADRQLIAAAPELYDALAAMLKEFDLNGYDPEEPPLSLARAALAKAVRGGP